MTVSNISREHAKIRVPESNACWVSIQEPGKPHIDSLLGELPTLRLKFWDIEHHAVDIFTKETIFPPTEKDAQQIVDFILENSEKDVICNCRLGYSRSAAVSKFCHDRLNYEWVEGKTVIRKGVTVKCKPNNLLYSLMCKYFDERDSKSH